MKQLALFPGQGAKHITLGYCVIHKVPQVILKHKRATTVIAGFPSGNEMEVSVAALLPAELPQEEKERLYLKYGYSDGEI